MSTETEALRRRVSQLEGELVSLSAQCGELAAEKRRTDAENAFLSRALVICQSFLEVREFDEVIRFTKELVINLIGTEYFGLYVTSADGRELALLAHEGVEDPDLCLLRREGAIATALDQRRILIAGRDELQSGAPLASIPLHFGESELGALLIFGLLAHKSAFDTADCELIALLSAQAARALYTARLHAGNGLQQATFYELFRDLKARAAEPR